MLALLTTKPAHGGLLVLLVQIRLSAFVFIEKVFNHFRFVYITAIHPNGNFFPIDAFICFAVALLVLYFVAIVADENYFYRLAGIYGMDCPASDINNNANCI